MSANLSVTVASGDTLDPRDFSVHERLSMLFSVTLTVVSENSDLDFEAIAGQPATFTLSGTGQTQASKTWTGLCSELYQVRVEPTGLATYHLVIVPTLWLAAQRRNHRMFQRKSELDIVEQLLGEWGVAYDKKITGVYKTRKYRVQYGESDFDFMSRMLEDAGITFYFEEKDGTSQLVLSDAPQWNELRDPPVAFRDAPSVADREHVTNVRVGRRVRPGAYTMRDVDYRRPASYPLLSTASGASGVSSVEARLERFHYTPGAFLFESDRGGDTPHADDKAVHRTDEAEGQTLAQKRLAAKRGDAVSSHFACNVMDLSPGMVMSVLDHPHRNLADGKRLLVVESYVHGQRTRAWTNEVEVRSADQPYHPELRTPKPSVQGVESATVVGPAGEEIHTDEFGRIRVHFHWDRESKMDDNSSCWIPVSQPWGGSGYGGTNLPRIGQEVVIDFLGGDPDRPLIVGRVYTNLQRTPYALPANKTQSGWKSNSSPTTGGYNEIMFEDAAGKELVRTQAEKDMHTLVKNDERHVVERDRSKLTKRNEDHTIGGNLTHQTVQNVRETIGMNHASTVGVNRATQIGQIDSTLVGTSHTVTVSPPGEGVFTGTTTHMSDDRIIMSTPSGAQVELAKSYITISADFVRIVGHKGVIIEAESGDLVLKGAPKVKIN